MSVEPLIQTPGPPQLLIPRKVEIPAFNGIYWTVVSSLAVGGGGYLYIPGTTRNPPPKLCSLGDWM